MFFLILYYMYHTGIIQIARLIQIKIHAILIEKDHDEHNKELNR